MCTVLFLLIFRDSKCEQETRVCCVSHLCTHWLLPVRALPEGLTGSLGVLERGSNPMSHSARARVCRAPSDPIPVTTVTIKTQNYSVSSAVFPSLSLHGHTHAPPPHGPYPWQPLVPVIFPFWECYIKEFIFMWPLRLTSFFALNPVFLRSIQVVLCSNSLFLYTAK